MFPKDKINKQEKLLTLLVIRDIHIKMISRFFFTSVRMTAIMNTNNSKHYKQCGGSGTVRL